MFSTAVMPPYQIITVIKKKDKTLDKQENKHIPVIAITENECGWTWAQSLSLKT